MKTLKRYKSWLGVIFLAGFAATAFIGCNKSDKGSAQVQQTPYQYGTAWPVDASSCMGCFPNASPILIGVKASSYTNSLLMSVDILGNPAVGMMNTGTVVMGGGMGGMYNLQDENIINYYNGQVMLYGSMRINAQDTALCNAPAGDYTMRTLVPGNMMRTGIDSIPVEAYSTTTSIRMRLNLLTFYNEQGTGLTKSGTNNRAGMQVIVDSVNSSGAIYPCVYSTFTTY